MTRNYPYFPEQDDEQFLDEAIDRLQRGDRSGLDRLDPKTAESVDYMVGLAREAGWTRGNLEDVPASRSRLAWVPPLRSLVAAALVVLLIGSMGMLGWRVIEDDLWPGPEQAQPELVRQQMPNGELASTEQLIPGAGVCDRVPPTADEIARIVEAPDTSWDPSTEGDGRPDSEINASLIQFTEDWNACLVSGQYDRAMAYESEQFLRAMAEASGVQAGENLTDQQIATAIANQHRNLAAMAFGEHVRVSIYGWSFLGRNGVSKAEMKMVPVDPQGDWVEWPTAITFVYEDGHWVILLTDREGSPATPEPW